MSKFQDLQGKTFGGYEVIEISPEKYYKNTKITSWVCKCIFCGKIVNMQAGAVKTNRHGCIQCSMKMRKPARTHGEHGTRLYRIWKGMKSRCNCKGATGYDRYGKVGLSVCDEWNKYENFRDWAILNGYTDDLTIDRKDNDKGYSPDNCIWATYKEQANNKKHSVIYEINGEYHTLTEWSEILSFNYKSVKARIKRGIDPIISMTYIGRMPDGFRG